MLPIALNPLIMRAVVVGKLVLCPFQDGYFVCLKDKPPTPWERGDELVTCVPTGRDFSEPVSACQSAFSETTTGIQKGCARTPYVATDHRNETCLKLAQPRRGDNTKSAIGYTQKANTSRFGHGTKISKKISPHLQRGGCTLEANGILLRRRGLKSVAHLTLLVEKQCCESSICAGQKRSSPS